MTTARAGRIDDIGKARVASTILIAGLVAGILDLAYAFAFHGANGVRPIVILQSIASGVMGPDAFVAGRQSALLGTALHFLMTAAMAVVYVLASLKWTLLWRRPLRNGAAYGLALYVLMTYVVVPLSAAPPRPIPVVETIGAVLAHVLLVGIPIALAARRL
jgi:uncharacterized membrane protein YagU involved in acid resistance